MRDFDWRSESDYTQRWETRHYDLDKLRAAIALEVLRSIAPETSSTAC
jgi:hypothetical protein